MILVLVRSTRPVLALKVLTLLVPASELTLYGFACAAVLSVPAFDATLGRRTFGTVIVPVPILVSPPAVLAPRFAVSDAIVPPYGVSMLVVVVPPLA